MTARARSRFLVVEDHRGVARAIERILTRSGHTTVAGSIREAERAVKAHRVWTAFFIDLGLPDGSGLDLLANLRASHPKTPALVLTGRTDALAINATYDLDASFVAKPVHASRIEQFLRANASLTTRIEKAVAGWEAKYELSEAESDVLIMSAQGRRRDAIARARATSELTVKKHAANLLRKTDDASLAAAVARLLREVAN